MTNSSSRLTCPCRIRQYFIHNISFYSDSVSITTNYTNHISLLQYNLKIKLSQQASYTSNKSHKSTPKSQKKLTFSLITYSTCWPVIQMPATHNQRRCARKCERTHIFKQFERLKSTRTKLGAYLLFAYIYVCMYIFIAIAISWCDICQAHISAR